MKVSNNVQENNIKSINAGYVRPYIPSLTFGKDTYTSAPKNIPLKVKELPYQQLYSSKMLLRTYANQQVCEQLLNSNPKAQAILIENGIKPEVHPENILGIQNSHLQTTNIIAQQIANQLHLSQLEKQILDQAAIFHDFGKILIPKAILEKPGELTDEERQIIDLHAELGSELLSDTTINKRTLDLIRNHHTPQKSNDILCQILSVADIYSALREQRSYKQPLTNAQALQILDQKAQKGEVSTEVVNALKEIVRKAA